MVYKSNKYFKNESLDMLKNKWLLAIFVCFLFWLLAISAETFTSTSVKEIYQNGQVIRETVEKQSGTLGFINLIFAGPISFGVAAFFLNLKRVRHGEVQDLFSGFNNFLKYFITNIVKTILIILWTMLLVIPGIIAYYKYSMTWYVFNDDPNLTYMEAIGRSKELMQGNKMALFSLQLSFIGWFFAAIFTLGLGFFPLLAYYKGAEVTFYEELIANEGIGIDY